MLCLGALIGVGYAATGVHPIDADIFWRAGHSTDYYGATWGLDGAWYVYPPPLAQILGLVPWSAYIVLWMTGLAAAMWAVTRWWALPSVAFMIGIVVVLGIDHVSAAPLVLLMIGNPHILVAAAIVIGLRWPAAWALVLLTKIGPGVGLLWFAARGEWRNLSIAVAATAVVAGVSLILAPSAWADFVAFAMTNAGTPPPVAAIAVPLPIRLLMSVVLIVWGARTDRRWTVPIAAGWASLALYEWSMLTMALAALPFLSLPRVRPSIGLPRAVTSGSMRSAGQQ